MSDISDVEIKSVPMNSKTEKPPASPTDGMFKEQKKLTTKEMIRAALIDLKSRKGTSIIAIKKYMKLMYKVDVEKINHIINRSIKSSVEDGSIVQIKGTGASGSFKLVESKKKENKTVKKKEGKEKKDKTEKKGKETEKKGKETAKKGNDTEEKGKDTKKKVKDTEKKGKDTEKKGKDTEKKGKIEKKDKPKAKKGESKPKDSKKDNVMKTPSKKKTAMMKRKSIGSIIKPPKMKPARGNKD